jgi:hypothetical protein
MTRSKTPGLGTEAGMAMMTRQDSDLLAEIERDALDESKPVAAGLRRCLALGGRAKSAELREWASRELHGYPGEAVLPDYRKIQTPLLMDGFTRGGIFRGKQVSVIDLPQEARDAVGDELPLTFGVGKIEALIRQAEERGGSIDLGPPAAAELALMMTHEIGRYQVERVYWSAGTGVLRGMVDAVRTTLTELVAEIRAGTAGEEGVPSPEIVGQAVQFAVYGEGNRITIATAGPGGTATATSDNEGSQDSKFWTWRRTGTIIVGLATIAGAIAAVLGGLFTAMIRFVKFISATARLHERWPVSRKDLVTTPDPIETSHRHVSYHGVWP